MRGIVKELPVYNYIYLGDTARTPYGTRSQEVIYEFTRQAVDFLFKNNCELIILACNTASSGALRKIQQEYLPRCNYRIRVLGVLIPAAEEAVQKATSKRIGIIATEATIKSNAFARELIQLNPAVQVFQKACPLLVPIVEAGEENSKAAQMILQSYLLPLKRNGIDTLILGCTHYGILENKIRKIMGAHVRVISEAKVVPKKLGDYLNSHREIEKRLGKNAITRFYSTDLTDAFTLLGSKFFGRKIKTEKAVLV